MLLFLNEDTTAYSQGCMSSTGKRRLEGAVLHSVVLPSPRCDIHSQQMKTKPRANKSRVHQMIPEPRAASATTFKITATAHLCSRHPLLLHCCRSPADGCTELVCPWLHLHNKRGAEIRLRWQPGLISSHKQPLLLQNCRLDTAHRPNHRQAAHQPSTRQVLHACLTANDWHAHMSSQDQHTCVTSV